MHIYVFRAIHYTLINLLENASNIIKIHKNVLVYGKYSPYDLWPKQWWPQFVSGKLVHSAYYFSFAYGILCR